MSFDDSLSDDDHRPKMIAAPRRASPAAKQDIQFIMTQLPAVLALDVGGATLRILPGAVTARYTPGTPGITGTTS